MQNVQDIVNSHKIERFDEIIYSATQKARTDRIEVDSQGRTTKESKFDLYIYYNFGNLEAENIEKITPC